ncbi:YihY/virulence factor BrkB family protein [Pararhodobacter aggregans]|uniref:YihY/virulence factor BrkB family protein n=1 Tax=Pararhodobacter aggregans TaxID=404875 RepID=A0A2T7UQ57_9RHOB|nr:YihY/virulence factor BrkB family protein [Pararhodobacter aggregans]PTX01610.1 membrane protein [Pararhodobacter aggregans]PVE46870.1 YihY/virulence factor BrkB family protein [Pararhodobacter aggregans]
MSGGWLNALPRLAMRVAVRMYQEVISDQIGLLAAGIAFYALLAIFPAMASVLAILGIFFSAAEITGPVETATAAIPPSAASLIREQASSIVAADHSALGVTAAVGLIAALYATARGMRHLIQGLNVAFNQTETRGIVRRWLAIILLAVFVIGGALLGMAAIAVIPVLLALFPEAVQAQSIVSVIRWVALFSISTAGIAVIYRFGPNRQRRSWHWTLPGAVVACLLWVIASAGFSLYAENFASYQRSFGALTGVIVLLTWLWLSVYVLLLGAELNAALEAVFHGERKRRAGAPEGAPAESVPRD